MGAFPALAKVWSPDESTNDQNDAGTATPLRSWSCRLGPPPALVDAGAFGLKRWYMVVLLRLSRFQELARGDRKTDISQILIPQHHAALALSQHTISAQLRKPSVTTVEVG